MVYAAAAAAALLSPVPIDYRKYFGLNFERRERRIFFFKSSPPVILVFTSRPGLSFGGPDRSVFRLPQVRVPRDPSNRLARHRGPEDRSTIENAVRNDHGPTGPVRESE